MSCKRKDLNMIKRKIRKVGCSLVVTVPSQLADLYNFKDKDLVECAFIRDNSGKYVLQYKKI